MKWTQQIFFDSSRLHEARIAISRTTSQLSQIWKTIGCTIFMVALVGCASSGPKAPPRTEGEILFNGAQSASDADVNFWTIGLKPFAGPDARLRAEQELTRLRAMSGLESAFILSRGERSIVCIGKVTSPSTAEADALLARVRNVRDEGTKPFAKAFYMPPTGEASSDLDLRSVPGNYGKNAIYTLQIGAYGRTDGRAPTEKDVAEARKKAEEAAADLRRQGELAFYYHGPSMSMVTVGVFGERDIQGSFSLELRDVMERFPHNLVNGQGVSQTVTTTDGRQEQILQPSFPVLIPTM